MSNRLTFICDKVMEAGWLAAVVFTPLYFNVYSSRVFEPDKISFLRNIVVMMTLAWVIKVIEQTVLRLRQPAPPMSTGRRAAAAVAEAVAPASGPLGFLPAWLRVPMVIPILIYAAVYIFASSPLVSIVPLTSLFGSYQRMQGLLSQSAYILLALIIIANMRTRAQFERLVTFGIVTSVPVALYGVLQFTGHDPLPWAGDVQTRVASSMGNAIFVAAWLIMAVPLTLQRFLVVLNQLRHPEEEAAPPEPGERLWPLVAIGLPAVFLLLLVQYFGMITGDQVNAQTGLGQTTPLDILAWVLVLVGLQVFAFVAWTVAGNAGHPAPPRRAPGEEWSVPVLAGVTAPILQIVVLWAALIFLASNQTNDFRQWIVLPGAIFIFYAFGYVYSLEGRASRMSLLVQVVALPLLIVLQGTVIFLTQSRGPQIGLLAGFLVFLGGMIYVVRRAWARYAGTAARREGAIVGAACLAGLMVLGLVLVVLGLKTDLLLSLLLALVVYGAAIYGLISWSNRERSPGLAGREVGFASGAIALMLIGVLAVGAFLAVFNLPDSPIASWRTLPYIGRLGTLLQADEGTGKVRTLIWSGAKQMILDSPARTLFGWGPEGMYVGYNKFYPPDLAHWELRNATPDRSHDFYIDQLVTMGALGLAAYLLLGIAFFVYGAILLRRSRNLTEQLITLGLMAMIGAHLVEGLTGIQIAATYTYFYMGLALLAVWGYYLTGGLRPQAQPAGDDLPGGNGRNGNGVPGDGYSGRSNGDTVAFTTAGPARAGSSSADAADGGEGTARLPAVAEPAAAKVAGRPADVTASSRPPGAKGGGGKKSFSVVTPTGDGAGSRRPAPAAPAPGAPTVPGARRTMPATATTGRTARPGTRPLARSAPLSLGGLANPALLAAYAVLTLIALWLIVGVNVGVVKADMFYKQGQAYDNQQAWPYSIAPYERAISLAPNEDFYYLFMGRAYMEWAKNHAQFDTSLPQGQNPDVKTLLTLSEQQLLKARTLNPMNTDHYANLGRLYIYWGETLQDTSKIQQGVQVYETAHSLSPGNAQIWNELGLAYEKAGRYQDAINALHGSIQMDDRYALSYFMLGEIDRTEASRTGTSPAAAQQMAAEAAEAYGKAVALDPNQIQDSEFDNRIKWLSNTNTITPVIAGYQQAISTTPDSTVPYAGLGYLYSTLTQRPAAIAQFEKAVSLACNDFLNLYNLALLYRDADRAAEARDTFKHALGVGTCGANDPGGYAANCPIITDQRSCTPITQSRQDGTQLITDIQQQITALDQQLNPKP